MTKQSITGEEHHAMKARQTPQKNNSSVILWSVVIIATISVIGLASLSLSQYFTARNTPSPETQEPGANDGKSELNTAGGASPSPGANLQMPAHGIITAISKTSITLKLLSPPEGSSKTFKITDTTKQHTDPQTGLTAFDKSKFKVGDQVAVVPAQSDSGNAGIIALQF